MRKRDGFEAEKILVLPDPLLRECAENPLTNKLYATDIGFFPHAKYHYRERSEGTDSYILIFCVHGEGWAKAGEDDAKRIGKYDMLVLPPRMAHAYGASDDDPWSIYWVHVRGELAPHYFRLFPLSEYRVQIAASDALRLTELFERSYALLAERSFSLPHRIQANLLLQQMLGIVAMQSIDAREQALGDYVERAIHLMRERLTGNLTIGQLAEAVNLSRSHFLAVFKRMTGISPMRYFHQLKIQQACTYLDLTDWPVKKIAGKLGYRDALYFSRVFKKEMGCSPSHYRERQKG